MPGTKLYERMNREQRLVEEKWWIDPDFYYGKSMFFPKNFSPEELEYYCYKTKLSFNSLPSIFHRLLDKKANFSSFKKLSLYLMSNFTNRREVLSKQGMKFGKKSKKIDFHQN